MSLQNGFVLLLDLGVDSDIVVNLYLFTLFKEGSPFAFQEWSFLLNGRISLLHVSIYVSGDFKNDIILPNKDRLTL